MRATRGLFYHSAIIQNYRVRGITHCNRLPKQDQSQLATRRTRDKQAMCCKYGDSSQYFRKCRTDDQTRYILRWEIFNSQSKVPRQLECRRLTHDKLQHRNTQTDQHILDDSSPLLFTMKRTHQEWLKLGRIPYAHLRESFSSAVQRQSCRDDDWCKERRQELQR